MKVNREDLITCLKKANVSDILHFSGKSVRSGNLSFQVEVPLPGELDLSCVVSGKPLLDMLKMMRAEEVEIVLRRGKLHITSAGLKMDFKVFKDITPLMKLPITDPEVEIKDLENFIAGMKSSSVCVSKDGADKALCGVRVMGKHMYACDKFRIFRYSLEEEVSIEGSIPLSFIKVVDGIDLTGGKIYAGTRITLETADGTTITSSLLSDDYPDLSRMFPDSDPVTVSFKGDRILDVLAKHGKYQRKVDIGSQEFEVMLTGAQCTIVSESELGVLQETLEMDTDIGNKEIGFFANPVLFDGVEKERTSFDFYPEDGVVMFKYGNSEYLIRTREE